MPAMRLLFALLLLILPARAADDTLSAAANSAFLAANAARPGTIVRPSGLQYRVLKPGFGVRPGGNDVVRIAYSLKLINGTLVDSTPANLPMAVALNSVGLAGLSEALSLMHVGERWQLVMPAALAFGVKGSPTGNVPGGQALVMDLTILSAAAPRAGETLPENPFSYWSNGREMGGSFTIHP